MFARVFGIRGSKEYSELRWPLLQLSFNSPVNFVDDDGVEVSKPVDKILLAARRDKTNIFKKIGDVHRLTRRPVEFFWEVTCSEKSEFCDCTWHASLFCAEHATDSR